MAQDTRPIPRAPGWDATLGFRRRPYTYIADVCRRRGADAVRTRLFLRPAVLMTGPEATRLFYDQDRFVRQGAMPPRPRIALVGRGGVQGLDDEQHTRRKAAFIALVAPTRVAHLGRRFAEELEHAASAWATMERVDLYTQSQRVLTRVVCEWAGVPLAADKVAERSETLAAMFDGAGAIGPRYWRARRARARGRRWIEGLVQRVRDEEIDPPAGSALRAFATLEDTGGGLLSVRDAATEVINVLRPTVAVSVDVVLIAHALHTHPQWRARLRDAAASERDDLLRRFVQEVRRCYPFFPVVAARVRRSFEWHGLRFPEGRRVVLDLYGTNHDPRAWTNPDAFDPDRFAPGAEHAGETTLQAAACPRGHDRDRYEFVPQGGADATTHHRCPGDPIAVELMKVATDWLARRLDYEIGPGDLSLNMSRLPALPRDGVTLARVRGRPQTGPYRG